MSLTLRFHLAVALVCCSFIISEAYSQIYSVPLYESKKYVTLFGGPSIPVGSFGDVYSNGGAKLGVAVGLDFMFPMGDEFEAGLTAAYNHQPVDKENIQYRYGAVDVSAGKWSLIWGFTSLGFNSRFDESSSFYGRGMFGFLVGVTPEQQAVYGNTNIREESSSSVSFAFGMALGFQISKNYELGMKLMSGNPEYEVTTLTQNGTITSKYEQSATTVQLVFGVRLN